MSRREKREEDEKKKKDNGLKVFLIVLIILLILAAGTAAALYFLVFNKAKDNEITYDQLYNDIVNQKVEKIEMTVGGSSIKAKYKGEDTEKTTKVNSHGFYKCSVTRRK